MKRHHETSLNCPKQKRLRGCNCTSMHSGRFAQKVKCSKRFDINGENSVVLGIRKKVAIVDEIGEQVWGML